MKRQVKVKRYLVMPGQGISGETMEAAVFRDSVGGALLDSVNVALGRFKSSGRNSTIAMAAGLVEEVTNTLDPDDFKVISQRFPDGPAVVAMTEEGRLALEAGIPDVRVLPMTRYYIPGHRPRHSKAGSVATIPAARQAVSANGKVVDTDAKHYFLSGSVADGTGKGVRVGIIDTGVDGTHPALQQAVLASRCFVVGADPTAGGPVNWGGHNHEGHGTHVAGIIGARPGNGGPAGVAPEADILSYRVFPDNPAGPRSADNSVIIDSIRAAIEDGCHIVNLSIEGPRLSEDGVRSAISDAWQQGVICIAATGNGNGLPVSYPAALPHCVAVTAIGHIGSFPVEPIFQAHVSGNRSAVDNAIFLSTFSNFGPQVQFTAPGHAIVSTFPGGEWWLLSGTSMAAPFVAGVLARVLSTEPNVLEMLGSSKRSAAMMQMLIGRAKLLKMPQRVQEGYGLPV